VDWGVWVGSEPARTEHAHTDPPVRDS